MPLNVSDSIRMTFHSTHNKEIVLLSYEKSPEYFIRNFSLSIPMSLYPILLI